MWSSLFWFWHSDVALWFCSHGDGWAHAAQASPDPWQLLNIGGRVEDPWGIQGTGCFPKTAYSWGESWSPPVTVWYYHFQLCATATSYCSSHSLPPSLKPQGVLTWFSAVAITRNTGGNSIGRRNSGIIIEILSMLSESETHLILILLR